MGLSICLGPDDRQVGRRLELGGSHRLEGPPWVFGSTHTGVCGEVATHTGLKYSVQHMNPLLRIEMLMKHP